jgi:hypothetical protein
VGRVLERDLGYASQEYTRIRPFPVRIGMLITNGKLNEVIYSNTSGEVKVKMLWASF